MRTDKLTRRFQPLKRACWGDATPRNLHGCPLRTLKNRGAFEVQLRKFVSLLKNTKIIPLCGAGINSKEDYLEALKLGCKGILVSSVVAKSKGKNPEKFLNEVS